MKQDGTKKMTKRQAEIVSIIAEAAAVSGDPRGVDYLGVEFRADPRNRVKHYMITRLVDDGHLVATYVPNALSVFLRPAKAE